MIFVLHGFGFCPSGEWVEQLATNNRRSYRLGFIGGNDKWFSREILVHFLTSNKSSDNLLRFHSVNLKTKTPKVSVKNSAI